MLQALLLSMHAGDKSKRVSTSGSDRPSIVANIQSSSELLQPVIDLLQYQQFCVKIKTELDKMMSALAHAGVPCTLRFHPVGETCQSLQRRVTGGDVLKRVGGEALLRIDERYLKSFCLDELTNLCNQADATLDLSVSILPDCASSPGNITHYICSSAQSTPLGRSREVLTHQALRVWQPV